MNKPSFADRNGEPLSDIPKEKVCHCGNLIPFWGWGEHGDEIWPIQCFDCVKKKIEELTKEKSL